MHGLCLPVIAHNSLATQRLDRYISSLRSLICWPSFASSSVDRHFPDSFFGLSFARNAKALRQFFFFRAHLPVVVILCPSIGGPESFHSFLDFTWNANVFESSKSRIFFDQFPFTSFLFFFFCLQFEFTLNRGFYSACESWRRFSKPFGGPTDSSALSTLASVGLCLPFILIYSSRNHFSSRLDEFGNVIICEVLLGWTLSW